ncbi:MAG: hypothetical protein ACXWDM_01315 [Nocardioides sp.]
MSGTSKDDDAWRAIVENYGERPEVEDERAPAAEPVPEPTASTDDASDPTATEPERFVPPDPPPAPTIVLPRHLPWVGVFGVPAVLLVTLLAGIGLPAWLGYLLISSFVGSFVYLVLTMKPGGRDPFDDGARL